MEDFDTANHEILFKILSYKGAPDPLETTIKRVHQDSIVPLKIGDKETEISHTVGVKQGNNMEPTLLIFLMQVFYQHPQTTLDNGKDQLHLLPHVQKWDLVRKTCRTINPHSTQK